MALCLMHQGVEVPEGVDTVFISADYFSVPLILHHVRDVQRQRHERGVPRKTPEVRLITLNRELGGVVDCQSALLSLTLAEMFRITPNVIHNAAFSEKQKLGHDTKSYSHPSIILSGGACQPCEIVKRKKMDGAAPSGVGCDVSATKLDGPLSQEGKQGDG